MGTFIQDIAIESKQPDRVSLSANPNFIQLESKPDADERNPAPVAKIDIRLDVKDWSAGASIVFKIESATNKESYTFTATSDIKKVDGENFYLDTKAYITAENIRHCLMKNPFLRSNFNITVPPQANGMTMVNGATVFIQSKRVGAGIDLSATSVYEKYLKVRNLSVWAEDDSLSMGLIAPANCHIELEVYKNTGVFLGIKNKSTFGEPAVSLSKVYAKQPIWFDVNSMWNKQHIYSSDFLYSPDWCDAGTIADWRFVAKRSDGLITETFYISDVLYTLTGYSRSLDRISLADYIYDTVDKNTAYPLTNQPRLTHRRGQCQLFNFILSDPNRPRTLSNIGILYRLKSQSGKVLTDVVMHKVVANQLHMVNTIRLAIDDVIEANAANAAMAKVGMVEVFLIRDKSTIISMPLVFDIVPDYLCNLRDFAFLNALGGWSSFNFSGKEQSEFKATTESIYKTQMPESGYSSEVESVYSKSVTEQFVAHTMPIRLDVAEWLKELTTSVAVYELSTMRYVIVDELNIQSSDKYDLLTLQMKYHYSDSYNGMLRPAE